MNWESMKGRWDEIKGEARKKWGRLTGDEIDEIAGDRDKLKGKLERVYGKTKEEAEKEVQDFTRDCGC